MTHLMGKLTAQKQGHTVQRKSYADEYLHDRAESGIIPNREERRAWARVERKRMKESRRCR